MLKLADDTRLKMHSVIRQIDPALIGECLDDLGGELGRRWKAPHRVLLGIEIDCTSIGMHRQPIAAPHQAVVIRAAKHRNAPSIDCGLVPARSLPERIKHAGKAIGAFTVDFDRSYGLSGIVHLEGRDDAGKIRGLPVCIGVTIGTAWVAVECITAALEWPLIHGLGRRCIVRNAKGGKHGLNG